MVHQLQVVATQICFQFLVLPRVLGKWIQFDAHIFQRGWLQLINQLSCVPLPRMQSWHNEGVQESSTENVIILEILSETNSHHPPKICYSKRTIHLNQPSICKGELLVSWRVYPRHPVILPEVRWFWAYFGSKHPCQQVFGCLGIQRVHQPTLEVLLKSFPIIPSSQQL